MQLGYEFYYRHIVREIYPELVSKYYIQIEWKEQELYLIINQLLQIVETTFEWDADDACIPDCVLVGVEGSH